MDQQQLERLWRSLCDSPYTVSEARIFSSGEGFVEYSIPSAQLKSRIYVRTQFSQREGNYEIVDRTVSSASSIHSVDRRWHFNGDEDSKNWTVLTPGGRLFNLPSRLHGRIHPSHRYSVWKDECCVYLAEAVVEKGEWPRTWTDDEEKKVDPFDYLKVHDSFGEQMIHHRWPKAYIVMATDGKTMEVPGLLEDEIVRDACILRVENNRATIMRIVQRVGDQPRLGLIHCLNRPTILELIEMDLSTGEIVRRSGRVGGLWYSVTAYGGRGYTLSATSIGMHSSAAELHSVTPWLSMGGMRCTLLSLVRRRGDLTNRNISDNDDEVILYTQGGHIGGPMTRNEGSIGLIKTIENQSYRSVLIDFGTEPPTLLSLNEDIGLIHDICETTTKSNGDGERRFIALESLENTMRPGYIRWLRSRAGEVRCCENASHLRIGVFPDHPPLKPAFLTEVRDRYWVAHRGSSKTVRRVGLFIHGGPSSVAALPMSPRIEMALRGMKLDLMIVTNYIGSLGIGIDPKQLMGQCGHLDVEDCCRALKRGMIEYVQHNDPNLAEDMDESAFYNSFGGDYPDVVVIGGSHGGFLGAHLIGQYPTLFRAAVLLNPVIDISAGARTTDIPDVLEFEVDGETDLRTCGLVKYAQPRFDESVEKQWRASPLRHVAKVKASVCLLLSGKDLRVHFSQGMSYFRALRACEVDAQVYFYPESCHPIEKPDHDDHAEVQGAMFVNARFKPTPPSVE